MKGQHTGRSGGRGVRRRNTEHLVCVLFFFFLASADDCERMRASRGECELGTRVRARRGSNTRGYPRHGRCLCSSKSWSLESTAIAPALSPWASTPPLGHAEHRGLAAPAPLRCSGSRASFAPPPRRAADQNADEPSVDSHRTTLSQRFCAGTPPSPSFLVAARHRRGPALPAFRERLGHVAATALPCARAGAPSSLSPKAELLLVHSLTHHRAGPELHGCRAMAMPWRADTHTCALPRPKAWPVLLTSTSSPLNPT